MKGNNNNNSVNNNDDEDDDDDNNNNNNNNNINVSGNVLTLNQRGSGGQKSTTIVREINGDTMINRLIVDNVTSVRVFKRIN